MRLLHCVAAALLVACTSSAPLSTASDPGAVAAIGSNCAAISGLSDSPRDDAESEQLAFEAEGSVVADDLTYGTIRRDLAAIRSGDPTLADIHAHPSWAFDRILLHPDAATFQAMTDGSFHDWDCLNTHYGSTGSIAEGSTITVLFLGRRLNAELVAAAYRSLPGQTAPPSTIAPSNGADGNDICASDGSYIFEVGTAMRGFNGTTPLGTFDESKGDVRPDWAAPLTSCFQWL